MPLTAGDKLGPYEILSPLGAGGMGEVWKARDTRLERTVAIKVSIKEFDERFQREAQAIASLNHPNICTLHDVGPDYLVMEFIEGVEVKGPQPVGEVLRLAIQIAEAVSHAHRHGVIHRDLKPGNILVTKSGVKVLDFGLAKLNRGGGAAGGASNTLAATMTQPGTIIGTPRYMAPELLEGREADARSDIFAFGLILYEIITGHPAFDGKTQANLIAAILAAEPKPVTSFQPLIPPALVHLLETCLAKDPDDRRQSMHDVLLELRWIVEGGSQAGIPKPFVEQRKRREYLSWAVAAVATLAAAVIGFVHFRETPAPVFPVRFEQPSSDKFAPIIVDLPSVSPDGRSLVYADGAIGDKRGLWLRRLDSTRAMPLPGTEGARLPFWSPDGRVIAFQADGKLKKMEASGGPLQIICEAARFTGGTWNRDGLIVFGMLNSPLQQVRSSGGEAKPLFKLDEARKETLQGFPHFLPDGRHLLYASYSRDAGKGGTFVGSIDGLDSRRVLDTPTNASFVWPGLLLYGRGQGLMAQEFDPGKFQATGEPFLVADSVGFWPGPGTSSYSSSPNGTLMYQADRTNEGLQATWYNREGKRLEAVGTPRPYMQGALSPDEKRLATQMRDTTGSKADIWILDLMSGIVSRVTSDPSNKDTPVWSPDGREILFSSNQSGKMNPYRKPAGGGDEQLVLASDEALYPAEWLKDGAMTLLNNTGRTFYRVVPGPGAKTEALLKTEYRKDGLKVSPDGRWAAYATDETGSWEVYIATFPAFTERRQVSINGGMEAYWRKDGKELFYLSPESNMMSVPIKAGPALESGVPKVLFATRIPVNAVWDQYAASGDGQRFLVLESVNSAAKPYTVVLNWPAGVKR